MAASHLQRTPCTQWPMFGFDVRTYDFNRAQYHYSVDMASQPPLLTFTHSFHLVPSRGMSRLRDIIIPIKKGLTQRFSRTEDTVPLSLCRMLHGWQIPHRSHRHHSAGIFPGWYSYATEVCNAKLNNAVRGGPRASNFGYYSTSFSDKYMKMKLELAICIIKELTKGNLILRLSTWCTTP